MLSKSSAWPSVPLAKAACGIDVFMFPAAPAPVRLGPSLWRSRRRCVPALDLDPVVLDTIDEFGRHYDVPGLPATFFIGRGGTLQSVHMGEISCEERLTSGIDLIAEGEAALTL